MRFEISVEVGAPADAVWQAVVNIAGWPQLTPSIERVEWVRGTSVVVGSQARVTQPRLGSNLWEVTEVEPGRTFAWRVSRPGATTVGTHALREVAPRRTELTLGIVQTGPLAPLLALLVGRRTRRYVGMEADGIRRRAEQGSGASKSP